jgi:hypothetical protein
LCSSRRHSLAAQAAALPELKVAVGKYALLLGAWNPLKKKLRYPRTLNYHAPVGQRGDVSTDSPRGKAPRKIENNKETKS